MRSLWTLVFGLEVRMERRRDGETEGLRDEETERPPRPPERRGRGRFGRHLDGD